jgi:hypothetical protein
MVAANASKNRPIAAYFNDRRQRAASGSPADTNSAVMSNKSAASHCCRSKPIMAAMPKPRDAGRGEPMAGRVGIPVSSQGRRNGTGLVASLYPRPVPGE